MVKNSDTFIYAVHQGSVGNIILIKQIVTVREGHQGGKAKVLVTKDIGETTKEIRHGISNDVLLPYLGSRIDLVRQVADVQPAVKQVP
ncbi:hypothetical protein D3C86_1899000 [compost metagenome]